MFDFEGSVKIATVGETTASTIVLHAHKALGITSGSLKVIHVDTSTEIAVTSSYEELREFLTLHLAESLVVGHRYEIYAEFRAPLGTTGRGLFLANYVENGNKM